MPSKRSQRTQPGSPGDLWHQSLEGDIALVGVRGRLDHTFASRLQAGLQQAIDTGNRHLIVDLRLATYINSGNLRTLVLAWRRARQLGGSVLLALPDGRIREILEMVGFDQVFRIFDTPADALAALTAPHDA